MVADISLKELKEKLKNIFSNESRKGHKYAEVWLSEADLGGLYYSGRFIVNIKAKEELESVSEETKYISKVLFNASSPEERSAIWRTNVIKSSERVYRESDDILVCTEADKCTS